jgi:hypothetical protein
MKKKKLLQATNLMALYSVLTRDAIAEKGPKNFQEKDRVLKYLERIERLSNKIREAMMEVFK